MENIVSTKFPKNSHTINGWIIGERHFKDSISCEVLISTIAIH
jgi:hypothetical protein